MDSGDVGKVRMGRFPGRSEVGLARGHLCTKGEWASARSLRPQANPPAPS